jgi:hypothetical protein
MFLRHLTPYLSSLMAKRRMGCLCFGRQTPPVSQSISLQNAVPVLCQIRVVIRANSVRCDCAKTHQPAEFSLFAVFYKLLQMRYLDSQPQGRWFDSTRRYQNPFTNKSKAISGLRLS